MEDIREAATQAAEPYISTANDVIHLRLQRADPLNRKRIGVEDEPFHPAFTYQIFGEEESIFGYENLQIDLVFRAHDMEPTLSITYSDKWKPIGEVKAIDLTEKLTGFLPDSILQSQNGNNGDVPAADFVNWRPPGKLINSYTRHGKQFEVWCSSLADPAATDLLRRMQILIPFFIEGGTCQNLDDQPWTMERWKIYLLYEVDANCNALMSPYIFAGFATSYRLWVFPPLPTAPPEDPEQLPDSEPVSIPDDDGNYPEYKAPSDGKVDLAVPADPGELVYRETTNPLETHSRERISQFLILPPYQGQSHGAQLYDTMYQLFASDPHVFEITVEEPSEAFDDLRDWADLLHLRTMAEFQDLEVADTVPKEVLKPNAEVPVSHIVPAATLSTLRARTKISPRQFDRLVEMQLLDHIPKPNRSVARIARKAASASPMDRRYYFWRLLVKERLLRWNRDHLAQIDADERVVKVEETLGAVEADYERLLEGAERRARLKEESERVSNGKGKTAVERKKRVIDEDDEDGDVEVVPVPAKKRKVSEGFA